MNGVGFGKPALFEIFVQEQIVVFRRRFHKSVLHCVHLLFQVFGYGYFLGTARRKLVSLFAEGVYVSNHFAVLHNGYLYGRYLACVLLFEGGNRARIVGVGLIHTVNEYYERLAQL